MLPSCNVSDALVRKEGTGWLWRGSQLRQVRVTGSFPEGGLCLAEGKWVTSTSTLILFLQRSCLLALKIHVSLNFPGDSVVKNLPANAGDAGLILGSGRFPWRRVRQPTPVFLPGESHGQRSLMGYSPQCRKESDTTWDRARTHIHRQISEKLALLYVIRSNQIISTFHHGATISALDVGSPSPISPCHSVLCPMDLRIP